MNLFPHQIAGADFLAFPPGENPNRFLGDEMRLGKCAQAVHACDILDLFNILVVCPAKASGDWQREFARHNPETGKGWSWNARTIVGLDGAKVRRGFGPAEVTIVSYETATRYAHVLSRPWDVLILDEAHYLKSRGAHRSEAIFGPKLDGKGGLAAHAARVWPMTGTPILNRPNEFHNVLHALFPETIRTKDGATMNYWQFTRRFCKGYQPAGRQSFKVTGSRNEEELRRRIAPIMLRRTQDECLDLPPLRFVTTPLVARRDEKLEREVADKVRAELRAGTFDGSSMSSMREQMGAAKAAAVGELVGDMFDSGIDKIVVFAWHKRTIAGLRERLADYGAVVVDGSVSPEKAARLATEFQEGAPRAFIGQIVSAGQSLTLDAAHHEVFAEMSYTPGHNAQAAMRCQSMTQKRPVLAQFCSVEGSVDTDVTDALRRKIEMIVKVIGAGAESKIAEGLAA